MNVELGPAADLAGGALGGRTARKVSLAARGTGMALVLLLGLLAGIGWLYALRGLGWLDAGPRVRDALPLLQLPGLDAQPLARLALAWIAAGAITALPMLRLGRAPRALIAWAVATALLLLASQVSFALARNLRLSDVIWTRSPGPGPWFEALLFAFGCALPAAKAGSRRRR